MIKGQHDKINILFVMMQMEMGGSERLVHTLVRSLDRNIFNPSVAWFFGNKVLAEFRDLDVPLYHVPKLKRFDLSTMVKLGSIIRNNNIHIVNAHHFMSMVYSFYGCKIKNHSKLIYTEHSEWELEKVSWTWSKIGGYFLSRADGTVGVTNAVSRQIQNKFNVNGAKAWTIINGVDLKVFTKSDGEKKLIRKKLNLSDDEKVIGIVANLKKIKNHIFLLKAFNKLLKDYKSVKLVVIGQGFKDDPENSEQEIRDYINENGLEKSVLLLGYRSDIPEILSIMDIFCLTSFKEGLPISLIEALAAGLPVVGTDAQGIRDIIIPNRNGLLVRIGDVDGLKNALLTLLRDETLRQRMGQESKNMARHSYSLEQCIKQYQDLFMRAINNDNRYTLHVHNMSFFKSLKL